VEIVLRESWMLAIETLSWMETRGLSEPTAMAKTAKQLGVSDSDSLRLAHHLVYETVRQRNLIDKFLESIVSSDVLSEVSVGVQAFLRLYVYQTRVSRNWSDVNLEEAETIVKLARSILGWQTLVDVEPFLGFLLSQSPKIVFEGTSDEERVGLQTFHPSWYVKYCFRLFGRSKALALLHADLHPPPAYIRLNTLIAREEVILKGLTEEGVEVEEVSPLRNTYRVCGSKKPLVSVDGFREGRFFIQDMASCYAAEAADPKKGMTVLDMCAAPGAKTTYLAQLMDNCGRIVSLDYSRRRMIVWKGEVDRMRVAVAEPIVADGRVSLPLTVEADVVVLDPPCTGTGTFGKLPSAKWRLSSRSVQRMADIQWQLLNSCVEHVKPGGTLVYSTCSITVEENEVLIERLLKWHSDFSVVEITPSLGVPGLRGLETCRRLYPHTDRCNGFFIAKLTRSES